MSKTEIKTEIPIKPQHKTTAAELFEDGTRSYVLHFRAGNRPPLQKTFLFQGSLAEAIERSKSHCLKMNYRFCGCYPFFVDLDLQEQLKIDELGLNEY